MIDIIADIIVELISTIIESVLGLLFKPDYTFKSVTQINEETFNDIIREKKIRGVILDVDETIRDNMEKVSKENDEWIDMISSKVKVIVLSNGYDEKIIKYFNEKNIKIISKAFKPMKKYFRRAKEELNLDASDILVIGDSSFSDVLGGNRMHMVTIRINKRLKEKKKK